MIRSKFIVMALLFVALCVPCAAMQTGVANAEEAADYVDVDMYPTENLKNKGVLYMDHDELFGKQMVFSVFDEKGGGAGFWYVGGSNVSVYDTATWAKVTTTVMKLANITPGRDRFIFIKGFFNAIESGEYYIVSAQIASDSGYNVIPIRIRKDHAGAYGFKYIPLISIIEICKKNPGMAKNMIGAEITLTQEDLNKIHKNGFSSELLIEPGEEFISIGEGGRPEPVKRKIYLLRKRPSLSSSFVDIEEPEINEKKVLSKKKYWYKLEVTVSLPFAQSQENESLYHGGTYRGFWQAPYDANGFPYLATEMVADSWKKLAGQYFEEQKEKE